MIERDIWRYEASQNYFSVSYTVEMRSIDSEAKTDYKQSRGGIEFMRKASKRVFKASNPDLARFRSFCPRSLDSLLSALFSIL